MNFSPIIVNLIVVSAADVMKWASLSSRCFSNFNGYIELIPLFASETNEKRQRTRQQNPAATREHNVSGKRIFFSRQILRRRQFSLIFHVLFVFNLRKVVYASSYKLGNCGVRSLEPS